MVRVLVVENGASPRDSLTSLFADHPFEVAAVPNIHIGLKYVREAWPDLVAIDLDVPVIEVFEFFRQLRSEPAIADTRVIFYTSVDEATALSVAAPHGVKTILPKPCDLNTAIAAINSELAENSPPLAILGVNNEP